MGLVNGDEQLTSHEISELTFALSGLRCVKESRL